MSPSGVLLLQLLNCTNQNQTSKPMNTRRSQRGVKSNIQNTQRSRRGVKSNIQNTRRSRRGVKSNIQNTRRSRRGVTDDDDASFEFLKQVRVAFKDNMAKYNQFLRIIKYFRAKRIHITGVKAKIKTLFKGHTYLVSEFNKFLPKEHQITPSLQSNYDDVQNVMKDFKDQTIDISCAMTTLKVLVKAYADLTLKLNTILPNKYPSGEKTFAELSWDVLDIICETLDFDDLSRFACVCTNWRDFHKSRYKSNFLASQEPLLVEVLNHPYQGPCSFISLPNQKVYHLKNMLLSSSDFPFPIYVTYSSGYFIFIADNSSFLLINPFTRIKKKVIYPSTFKFSYSHISYHALLAFDQCFEEEFVLLFLFKESFSLHVYHSQNNAWVTYSTPENSVVDFVVLHNIIYVLTNKAKIGVLSLNSGNIKFLTLKNTPSIRTASHLNLVNCDDQLLVVDLTPMLSKRVYKINLWTMSYVQLETLGDIALFYVWWKSCMALSNPNRWGYESNSVYEVSILPPYPNFTVYNWDQKSNKFIDPPSPKRNSSVYDWCLRHLRYEVDYSLVD